MMVNEDFFEGEAGLKIFFRAWEPEERGRGVVVIVHGFNAHSGHYQWVAEQLVKTRLAVYALDLQGRGKSEGERFYVEKFADYVGDLAAFVELVKSREPGLPVFLMGHSAGGVVSCLYAIERQADLAGLICESFAFRVPAPDFALAVIKGVSHVAPHAHVLKLNNADFSRDPTVVEAMNQDPLTAGEVQPTLTVAELARADERLEREFSRIQLPLLIIHGTADKATKASGSQFFYDQAGSKDKILTLYKGHFHDLLNDVDKERVLRDIETWIIARLPV
jgi:acylglycerol lipase